MRLDGAAAPLRGSRKRQCLIALNFARIVCARNFQGSVALFPRSIDMGYAPAGKERRAHFRFAVDEEAQLVIPSEYLTLPCRVMNLSDGGAGVQCDVVPQATTKVKLLMKDGRVFEAVTAWFEDGQLGLRFVSAQCGKMGTP
jgi:hypothetical protein